ncbi:MAG: redoxin domain-containing protein [Spirochaetaceae bacterium]|nr:redoxin domain-containing protein [Spirochaetaceae bacterium]
MNWLISLSIDQIFSHIKWAEWIKEKLEITVPFPINGDELGILDKLLGIIHKAKVTNKVRAIFIIGPNSIIRLMIYYPQEIGRSVDEVLKSLKALIISTENHVSSPENYPYNELLRENVVMLPPPGSIKEIEKNKK